MFFANFGIGKYRFSYYENRLRNLGFTQFRKCFSFMHCNMVSLIALDGILGVEGREGQRKRRSPGNHRMAGLW